MPTLHLFLAGKACRERNIMTPSMNLFWVLDVLGVSAKLRKATIRFFISVRPSVSLHGTTLTVVFLALTEVLPRFFLSCKANTRVKPAKMGHGPHSSYIFVLFYVLFVLFRSVYFLCKCVLYCHQVATQLQLTNIS
jgi:hypothetical protein